MKTVETPNKISRRARVLCAGILAALVVGIAPSVSHAATASGSMSTQGVVVADDCLFYSVDRVSENHVTHRSAVYGHIVNTCDRKQQQQFTTVMTSIFEALTT